MVTGIDQTNIMFTTPPEATSIQRRFAEAHANWVHLIRAVLINRSLQCFTMHLIHGSLRR